MKFWKDYPLFGSTADALLTVCLIDFFMELESGPAVTLAVGTGGVVGAIGYFVRMIWGSVTGCVPLPAPATANAAPAIVFEEPRHSCGTCGAFVKRSRLGRGGGELICSQCGPVGSYAYRTRSEPW